MSKTRTAFIVGLLMLATGILLVVSSIVVFAGKTLSRWMREGRERRRAQMEERERVQRKWVEQNL